jgi:hypothetical protein
MLSINPLKSAAKVAIALLTFGVVIGSVPVLADNRPIIQPKPLIVPTGTVRDLEGIAEKNSSQWLGGVGGEYDATVETQPAYENQTSSFLERTKTINQHWQDVEDKIETEAEPLSSFRVPFTQF